MNIETLKFENLSLEQQGSKPVFDAVNFEFPMNGTFQVRASNGAGKSLLLKLLAGIQEPTGGRYLVNGLDVSQMSFEEYAPYRLRTGYAFDSGGLISNRTIRQNLMLPFFFHRDRSADEAEARVTRYCKLFELSAVSELRPAFASNGQRKACLLARAIIHEPQLLLLDDPTGGLDGKHKTVLIELIKSLQAGGLLRHLYFASEDESFTRYFDFSAVDISRRGLQIVEAAA
ncbi:MAG: ATP-binding cassette domain-containing protein [Deltaproteobacteria bacterium]|nr:ATP-binding cassette domain-containing protein [Deltaproteobacteria bacterium]